MAKQFFSILRTLLADKILLDTNKMIFFTKEGHCLLSKKYMNTQKISKLFNKKGIYSFQNQDYENILLYTLQYKHCRFLSLKEVVTEYAYELFD